MTRHGAAEMRSGAAPTETNQGQLTATAPAARIDVPRKRRRRPVSHAGAGNAFGRGVGTSNDEGRISPPSIDVNSGMQVRPAKRTRARLLLSNPAPESRLGVSRPRSFVKAECRGSGKGQCRPDQGPVRTAPLTEAGRDHTAPKSWPPQCRRPFRTASAQRPCRRSRRNRPPSGSRRPPRSSRAWCPNGPQASPSPARAPGLRGSCNMRGVAAWGLD